MAIEMHIYRYACGDERLANCGITFFTLVYYEKQYTARSALLFVTQILSILLSCEQRKYTTNGSYNRRHHFKPEVNAYNCSLKILVCKYQL